MNRIIVAVIFALFISVFSILFYTRKTVKICYVRNQYLVENFAGMKDAQNDFNEKFKQQRNYLDSLQLLYKTLQMQYGSSPPEGRKKMEDGIRSIQGQIEQYSNYYRSVTSEEDKRMTEQVLSQVNAYIKEFGEANDYQIIIGSTTGGNVLYGKSDLDITEELLEKINELYKGKK